MYQLLSNKCVYSEKLRCKAATRGVLWKKGVLTNYTKFTGKQSLFFKQSCTVSTKYLKQNREIQ